MKLLIYKVLKHIKGKWNHMKIMAVLVTFGIAVMLASLTVNWSSTIDAPSNVSSQEYQQYTNLTDTVDIGYTGQEAVLLLIIVVMVICGVILLISSIRRWNMLRKVYIISISALFIALMSIGTSELISNSTNTTYINNTYINNTNISGGDINHSNLTNLNWSVSNHTIDTILRMNNFSIRNAHGIYMHENQTNQFNLYGDTGSGFLSHSALGIDSEAWQNSNGNTIYMRKFAGNNSGSAIGANIIAFYGLTGNITNPNITTSQQQMFFFSGRGYTGSAYTGSKVDMKFRAYSDWNATSTATEFIIGTTKEGTTSLVESMKIPHYGGFEPTLNNTYDLGTVGMNFKRVWATTFAGGEFADKIGSEGYDYYDLFQYHWKNYTGSINPIYNEYDEIIGYNNQSISKRIPTNTQNLYYSAVELNGISGKWELSYGIGSSSSVAIIPADDELISDGRLVILGGYKAKVYGNINVGDKLIVSNRAGVLTNAKGISIPSLQYNFNTNQWVSVNLPASNNPDVYNKYDTAQGVSTTVVAIALESYNSQSTGLINVKVLNT